jgi:hypothetical protein
MPQAADFAINFLWSIARHPPRAPSLAPDPWPIEPLGVPRWAGNHIPLQPPGAVWAFAHAIREQWGGPSTRFQNRKPGLVQDLLLQQLVKMRTDALLKSKGYLMMFAPAVVGPRLG